MTADDLDIPTLDPAMQATRLVTPVTKWGTIARSRAMGGTYHFYTADYKFSALGDRPGIVPASGCRVAVEPNYSTQPGDDPEAVLAYVRRKRALARGWQAHGVRIVVDLNVEPEFRDLNLLGVPPGWSAFAVRCQKLIGWDVIEADHEAARRVAGGNPRLFVVFGGGRAARSYCERRGWAHVHEHAHLATGRVRAREAIHHG